LIPAQKLAGITMDNLGISEVRVKIKKQLLGKYDLAFNS